MSVCHASFCVQYDCLSVPEYLCKVCAEGFIEFAISPWKPRKRNPLPFQEATSYHFLPPQLSTLVICGEHHPALPEVLRQRTPPCEKRVEQRMALPSLLSMLMWLYWRSPSNSVFGIEKRHLGTHRCHDWGRCSSILTRVWPSHALGKQASV